MCHFLDVSSFYSSPKMYVYRRKMHEIEEREKKMHERNSDIYIIHYDMANVHGFYHFRNCRSLLHVLENKHSQFILKLLLLLLGPPSLRYVPLEMATVIRFAYLESVFFSYFSSTMTSIALNMQLKCKQLVDHLQMK